MQAVTFWSHASPSDKRGYPPSLAVAIVTIAITTCIAANFLLAHVATLARNKLAEIVVTRKQLWKTIAQKENAEAAAAARTDFIGTCFLASYCRSVVFPWSVRPGQNQGKSRSDLHKSLISTEKYSW